MESVQEGNSVNCASIKNNILMISLNKFYKNKSNLNKFLKIINGDSKISLRIVDWFVTNYSKKNNISYNIFSKNYTVKKTDVVDENDIIEQETISEDFEAFLTQIDFEKAFDSIEWKFLFQTLEQFNFGDYFIKWIKTFYKDIYSCVGNNGTYSEYFKLTRSIRQGCPISALLFLLVAEIVAITIRNDNKIKGVKIGQTEFKLGMMADDTSLYLNDIKSISQAIAVFKRFTACSGLKLNLNKT